MIVYKYRPVDKYTLELLINNEFHFSFPKDFNDPNDCFFNPDFESTPEKILDWINKNPGFNETTKLIAISNLNAANFDLATFGFSKDKVGLVLQDKFILSCFSEDKDNEVMWSHYANSHKGIVLGFEVMECKTGHLAIEFEEVMDFVPPNKVSYFWIFFKVQYVKDRKLFNVFQGTDEDLTEYLHTKSINWNYENELRLILDFDDRKKQNFKFAKKILREIIFGLKTSEEDKKIIKDIIEKKYLSHGIVVKYFQCIRKEDKLMIIHIDD